MSTVHKLIIIKAVHTIIWAIMAAASFYILYAGIVGRGGYLLMFCAFLLIAESLVLAINHWTCPLTPMAARYTDNRQANFDIYLPLCLARYNKQIFGTIFGVGIALILFRLVLAWL